MWGQMARSTRAWLWKDTIPGSPAHLKARRSDMVPRQLRRREGLWMRNIHRKAGSRPSVKAGRNRAIDTVASWNSNRTSRSGGGALAYRNGTSRAWKSMLSYMSGGGIDTKVVKRSRRKCRDMMAQRLAVIVDAMVTGRVVPMILLAVWSDFLGFAGRRDARRALDGNPLM